MNNNNTEVSQEQSFELPKVTFSTFITSLASSALVCLGEVPDPSTGVVCKNILMAKHNIDILEMLSQKTQGQLDHQEKMLLDNFLYELRVKYVIISKSSDK